MKQPKETISLLETYNLTHTVNFCSKIFKVTRVMQFITFSGYHNISLLFYTLHHKYQIVHDAQYVMNGNFASAYIVVHLQQRTRNINNEIIILFQVILKCETWELVHKEHDTKNNFK